MKNVKLELYWSELPTGKENAVTYDELCALWLATPRKARLILHELSLYDDGSDFVLIRSASCKGFYKTNDLKEIKAYRKEVLHKGRSVFAPVKKINRILTAVENEQYSFTNNMRIARVEKGFKQADICEMMKQYDKGVDASMLSKFENGVCLPTPYQLALFAKFYDCSPQDLITTEFYC